jgi:hypothetical protein
MWDSDVLSVPDVVVPERTYILSKQIPAIQLVPTGNGGARYGPVLNLPEGAELEACGSGFNDRTLKVRYEGSFYFVFLEDLELKRKTAASASY